MLTDARIAWKDKAAAIRRLEHGGRVDPLDLIEAARDPSHPCHGDFTWDVEAAAEERWRDQARALIRACKFEVIVEDVGTPVVQYVPSGDEDSVFVSLPKMRSKSDTNALIVSEIAALNGLASRVYGIVLAKQAIVGTSVVSQLRLIRDRIAAVQAELDE
jgi:hypothetical protein